MNSTSIVVLTTLKQRAALSREAARRVLAEVPGGCAMIDVDFTGVDAVGPSFVDEFLRELSGRAGASPVRIRITGASDRLVVRLEHLSGSYDGIVQKTDDHILLEIPAPVAR